MMCEASVKAAAGRIPVMVMVGAYDVDDAKELARHAEAAGADAISSGKLGRGDGERKGFRLFPPKTHTCAHTYTHTCAHTYTHTCAHTYTQMRAHVHTHMRAHICTYAHTHTHTQRHIRTQKHTGTYARTHTCRYTPSPRTYLFCYALVLTSVLVAPPSQPGQFDAAIAYWKSIGSACSLPFYVYWIAATADKSVTPQKVI